MGACTSLKEARRQGSGVCNDGCFILKLNNPDSVKGVASSRRMFLLFVSCDVRHDL